MNQNQDPNLAQGGQQWNQDPNQQQGGQNPYQASQGGQQWNQNPNPQVNQTGGTGQGDYQNQQGVNPQQVGQTDQGRMAGGNGNVQPNQAMGQSVPTQNQTTVSSDVTRTTEQHYTHEVDQSTSQAPGPNQGGGQMGSDWTGDPNVDPNTRRAQADMPGDTNAQQAEENRGGLGSKLGNLFNRHGDPNDTDPNDQ